MARDVTTFYGIDMSGATDNAAGLAHMRADMANLVGLKKPLPCLRFPEGICSFSSWPNMAFHNLEMRGEGQSVLRYTGTDDAVVFMGEEPNTAPGLGKRNVVFDGFTIDPGKQSRNGLVLNAMHASMIRAKVIGAGAPRNGVLNSAISMNFCVCAELHPTVSSLDLAIDGFGGSFDCYGLTLNSFSVPEWQASACRIERPIIEGVTTGIFGLATFFCEVRGGTIEQCKNGAVMVNGRGNLFDHVEMEGNADYDVWCTKDFHDNVFAYCGDGHRRTFKIKIEGYLTNNQVIPIGSLWT